MTLALAVATTLLPGPVTARPPRPVAVIAAAPRENQLETALRRHVETLASDDFGGREPGTDGETKTLRYLARQWFDIGLVSGTNDPGNAWFAPVELIERTAQASRASFAHGRRRIAVDANGVLVVTSGLRSLIENAPLLLVGRETNPKAARIELAGRIAVVFDSQSAPAAGAPASTAAPPGGAGADERAGRLLDAGAAAVITVLDGTRALDDVAARRRRPGYALAGQKLGGDIQAYVTPAVADSLFDAAGLGKLAALRTAAADPAFVPRLIGLAGTLEATSSETRIHTHNLIGKLEGRRRDLGAVVLVAHWDHFGRCADPPAEHLICNGAVDNASGLAVITEAARILTFGRPPDRDIYFLATTGEELGLLGALAFTENPPLPLDAIMAVLNVDSTGLVGPGLPVSVIGSGMTDLDDSIAAVLKSIRRKQVVDSSANAYVRRQDGWVFIQHDVPAVMVSSAYSDPARLDRFMDERYHRPTDVPARVEYGGMGEDVALQVELARYFADVHRFAGPPVPRLDSPTR
ncbi:M28 family peptidase [Novosphingobium sp.]|uniref:M28 family metallopeptidase n=1 Tax=Novosphingobium sp. TaxID=1874826 RepID=UPI003340ED82